MMKFYKMLSFGRYREKGSFKRCYFDLDVVNEVAPGVGLVFELIGYGEDCTLNITVMDTKGDSKFMYELDTEIFLGNTCGILALPRSVMLELGGRPKVMVDLIDVYQEKAASL